MHIPSTKGEVSDLIGAMVLCMPDMELPNSGLDMTGAFALLEQSLGLIRSEVGDQNFRQLIQMSRQSHRNLLAEQLKVGLFILQDMKVLLNGRSRQNEE